MQINPLAEGLELSYEELDGDVFVTPLANTDCGGCGDGGCRGSCSTHGECGSN